MITELAERDILLRSAPPDFQHPHFQPVEDPYVLRFWLRIVGPTVYCAAQMAALLGPVGQTFPVPELASILGLSGKHGTLNHSIQRSLQFSWARVEARNDGPTPVTWTFVDHVQTLRPYQIKRLSEHDRRLHDVWSSIHAGTG